MNRARQCGWTQASAILFIDDVTKGLTRWTGSRVGFCLAWAGVHSLITPRMGLISPEISGANTPAELGLGGGCGTVSGGGSVGAVGQQQMMKLNTAFICWNTVVSISL